MLPIALVMLAASPRPPLELPPNAVVFSAGQDTVAKTVAAKVEVEFAAALKKKGVALADVEALFPPPAGESPAEGEALFAKGKEAYDNLDFEGATKILAEAAIFFIKRPGAAKAEQLGEIFLFLGASDLQNGSKTDAAKDFIRALQMNPTLMPDSKYFGLDVQQAFTAAQKELAGRKKGTLSVASVPAGAEVEAFGLTYGRTPVNEIELPAGRYLVQVKRPGFAPSAAFPDVQPGKSIELTQKLAAAPELISWREKAEKLITPEGFEGAVLPLTAIDLGKAFKARTVVLLAVTSGAKAVQQVELQAWNVSTGDRLKGVKFEVDPDGRGYETGAEALEAWLRRPGAAMVSEAPVAADAPAVQPSGDVPVFKKWWFWAAIGGVAVAAGVTTAVVASQPHEQQGFNVLIGQP